MRSNLIIIFLFFLFIESPGQDSESVSVLFYNTENLFDWENDTTVNDDEYTPEGERHWTYQRFQHKIQQISKAILAASGWNTPVVIGLCEIENRDVLEQLVEKTALKSYPFRIIHKDSPDPRGIDVAMLYNADLFNPVTYDYFPLLNEDGSVHHTREVLYVKGTMDASDTLHFFFNHWPSRYSGLLETKEWRNKAATLLKQKTDSLFSIDSNIKIIVMGDFNDQPSDESIQQLLSSETGRLHNLSSAWGLTGNGTIKYQAQWFVFDQIIVSDGLRNANNGVTTKAEEAKITREKFLIEPDERYGGEKPNRTYNGFQYQGGFADHLPVKLMLEIH